MTTASKAIPAQAQIRARKEYIRTLIFTLEAYVTTALSGASIDFSAKMLLRISIFAQDLLTKRTPRVHAVQSPASSSRPLW
jgi:hypothetical protein